MVTRKIFTALVPVLLLLSLVFSGCQTGGISQAQYDQVVAQLEDIQAQLSQAQNDLVKEQVDKADVDAQLQDTLSQIASLQDEINALKDQNTLTGATPAETAEKIVAYYHQTHVYSSYDLFVCSDMASEVWNMLKAQDISSVVVVGNKDTAIGNILQCLQAFQVALQ